MTPQAQNKVPINDLQSCDRRRRALPPMTGSSKIAHPLVSARCRGRTAISEETDAEVVRLAGKGDDVAWQELVHRFGRLIHCVAKRNGLSDSDAADVAQVTWVRLSTNLDRLRDPDRIAGWLATTARRESLRVAINATRQVPSADPFADHSRHPQTHFSADTDLDRAQYVPALERALARLPLQYQRLLGLLSSDAGLSYSQVAEAMAVSIGSIGPMRQRALQLLRRDAQLMNAVHN